MTFSELVELRAAMLGNPCGAYRTMPNRSANHQTGIPATGLVVQDRYLLLQAIAQTNPCQGTGQNALRTI